MFKNPTSYTTRRKFTHLGVTYNINDPVPVDVVMNMKKSDHMLSMRYIVGNIDPHGRKGKTKTPTPVSLPAQVRQKMTTYVEPRKVAAQAAEEPAPKTQAPKTAARTTKAPAKKAE